MFCNSTITDLFLFVFTQLILHYQNNIMMKQEKIFIIEDDQTIVDLLTNHLRQSYTVYRVNNFRDIRNEVETIKPDLILMDITLPYFNGFYWTTEIRKTADSSDYIYLFQQ
jgi:DNA-binding response OmpR family regulator